MLSKRTLASFISSLGIFLGGCARDYPDQNIYFKGNIDGKNIIFYAENDLTDSWDLRQKSILRFESSTGNVFELVDCNKDLAIDEFYILVGNALVKYNSRSLNKGELEIIRRAQKRYDFYIGKMVEYELKVK